MILITCQLRNSHRNAGQDIISDTMSQCYPLSPPTSILTYSLILLATLGTLCICYNAKHVRWPCGMALLKKKSHFVLLLEDNPCMQPHYSANLFHS